MKFQRTSFRHSPLHFQIYVKGTYSKTHWHCSVHLLVLQSQTTNSKISLWGSLIIYKSNELYKFHLSRTNHVDRGGSRTPATSKMKLFMIIVNGWKLSASLWLEKSSEFLRLELFYNFSFNNFNNIAYQIRSVTNILFFFAVVATCHWSCQSFNKNWSRAVLLAPTEIYFLNCLGVVWFCLLAVIRICPVLDP